MFEPGAENGDELARTLHISSAARARQSLNRSRMELTGLGGSPGKKWSRSALLSSNGVEAPESYGKRGDGRPTDNLFTVQTGCGVAEARKGYQWSL